ncbi:MAG: preprotein translocase subunit SecE [Bdellovibrionales bacterium]
MDTEKSNESFISTAFAFGGILVYFIVSVLLEVAAGTFGVVARFRSNEVVQHGLPVGLGLATFLVLFMNKKTHAWADECVTEVRKVVWPSRKDTIAMTMVCCVMVLVSGVAFGIFDFFASQLIKIFVN